MSEQTLREQLESHFDSAENTITEPVEKEIAQTETVEEPAPAAQQEQVVSEPQAVAPQEPAIDAPQSWTAEAKKDWAALPPSVKAEIMRRESDTHKMLTKHDGELRLGRDMKEVIEPFAHTIKEAGAEPKALIHELLGTVNTLRNGTEEQKISVMRNIAQGYGIDLNKVMTAQIDPVQSLMAEINSLRNQVNPDVIINQLQERQESARIKSEIEAFAADPANKHFEKVKALMAPLLSSGQAATLQEAYISACYADPTIRSTMMQEQSAPAKRVQEIAQKKNAAVSIKGSPSAVSGNINTPNRNLREELAAQMDAALGSKI